MDVVRRSTAALAAALLGIGLLTAAGPPASAAAPTVDLEPARLTRGPDIAVAHIDGDDLVVGTRRVDLPGARAQLLGASGDAYVVGTSNVDGTRNRKILRVEADDSVTTLRRRASPYDVVLSEDGRRLASVSFGTRRASTARVWSARTGKLLARKSFADYPAVLAARSSRVLLTTGRRVFWWSTRTGRTRTVTTRSAGIADITHDLLTTYTDDPYLGGCTRLTPLSRPRRTLWRSCTERVAELSPDGTRMATIGILSDGIGPGEIVQREIDGTRLATYTASWFGAMSWESPGVMLLETHGRRKTATVRCDLATCENADDPVRTVVPRASAGPSGVLEPELLPRGADPAVAHVDGSTVVDGSRRIPVDAREVTLVREVPAGYVVVVPDRRSWRRTELVRRDGTRRVLVPGADVGDAAVSDDGRTIASGALVSDGVTRVVVRRIGNGRRVASRVFGYPGGFTEVVALSATRALLGRSRGGRVAVWDLASSSVREAADEDRWVYAGDLRHDLLAARTKDNGRCSVVTRISDTDRVLWRSCRERVLAFSPDGRRLVTAHTRARQDGLRTVSVRAVRTGRVLARHRARSFGDVRFETARRLLLWTEGSTHSAIVRCVDRRCRTASDPVAVPEG